MKLYKIDDLKNSRIFFDKRPPKFLTIFIISVFFILIGALWICTVLPKNYIVEAQGTVTTEDNKYVGALSEGSVIEIKKQENEWVEKGDILFTISTGSEGVQSEAIEKQLDQANEKQKAMDLYEKSLSEGINYLSNEGLQQEYYGKMAYYLSVLEDENNTKTSTENELRKKQEKLQTKKDELTVLQNELSDLKKQQESITIENKTVEDDSEEVVSHNTENTDIQASITEKQSQIETKESEIESLETEIDQSSSQSYGSQAQQTKLQLISELGTSRTTLETNIVELKAQLEAYAKQDNLTEVEASQSGYLHYLTGLKDGMSVQKGQVVAEISENKENQMMVEAYIQATDRSKVSVGDQVKVAIQGVNTQKYGTLSGKLTSIDSGTMTQESSNGNIILYKCEVIINEKELVASNQEKIQVVKSMPVVARIIYEKETYMDWILEMLNFKN